MKIVNSLTKEVKYLRLEKIKDDNKQRMQNVSMSTEEKLKMNSSLIINKKYNRVQISQQGYNLSSPTDTMEHQGVFSPSSFGMMTNPADTSNLYPRMGSPMEQRVLSPNQTYEVDSPQQISDPEKRTVLSSGELTTKGSTVINISQIGHFSANSHVQIGSPVRTGSHNKLPQSQNYMSTSAQHTPAHRTQSGVKRITSRTQEGGMKISRLRRVIKIN